MQLIEGAKGAFPAARNTNLPCIPATRIGTNPWSLFGKESEAQMLASFTEYTERDDLQLLLWTFCNQNGDIALVCSKTMGGNTVALAIRTPGPQDDFAKKVARIMSNVATSNGKRMQCTVDIKSLQPWSVGVSGIPYMVGVAEELLRLATFTTEFDIKAVIADRAVYCFEVVCEHVQKELRGTENEFPWAAESSDMINNPGQTFKRFPTYY